MGTSATEHRRVWPTTPPDNESGDPERGGRSGPGRAARAWAAVTGDEAPAGLWTRRVAIALGLWAAWYAAYRFYYALGGQIGMVGRPAPAAHFRHTNFIGGAIILLAALLPPIAVWAWRHQRVRRLVIAIAWVATVGCCIHALTLMTVRVLSLTGVHPTHYPPRLWLSINPTRADLQDLLFNEPWFLVEGLLWGLFALTTLPPSPRRAFRRSAVMVCVLGLAVGVLSGLGVIPTFRYG